MNEIERKIYDMDLKFVNSDIVKKLIAKVVLTLPLEVQDFIEDEVLFIGPDPEENASCLNLKDLVEQNEGNKNYIVYLDTSFYSLVEEEQEYILAHEIGHAYNRHGNENDSMENEEDADKFAVKHGFYKTKVNKSATSKNNDMFDKIDCIIKRINDYRNDPLLANEISGREQRNPESLDSDNDFLTAVAVLITFSQNARSDKVQDLWGNTDYFNQAFSDFDIKTVASLDSQSVIANHWDKIKAIRFKKKIDSVIKCAQVINKIGQRHGTFLQFFQQAAIPERIKSKNDLEQFWKGFDFLLSEFKKEEMPFLGNTTTLLHMLLDMGYDCVKPDLVLLKFAEEIGVTNKEKFVRLLQEYCLSRGIRPSVLDLYLLIYNGQLGAKKFVSTKYYNKK